ncbi:MAG TPA: DUF3048 domain-containing protein [Acidimicrobiales bacterium]
MFARRLALIVVALCLFGALPPVMPGAHAQDLAARKEELERRKAELDRAIAEQERAIADAEQRIANATAELRRAAVELELVADEYAQLVDSRREPAHTRVQIAIDAYMRGDPRITSLIEDLITLDNQSDDLLKREMYRAVVEDADARLAEIDAKLREIGERAQREQAETQSVRDELAAAEEAKRAATESRDQLAAERAEVVRELDDILSRANRAPLTGLPGFNDPNRPALVVKIDNVDAARPPIGVNNADVVFEELVEGGLTRLAAVFHSRDADPVGPVRSVRSTDIGLLTMLNKPLFASSGGNPGVRAELAASSLVDIGHTELPGEYHRINRRAPHNLVTNTSSLRRAAAGQGGAPPALFSYRSPGAAPATAVPASGVNVSFPSADISYSWTGSGWARSQNGSAHVDSNGARIAPTNVIVQFVQYGRSSADENSPEAITVGSGDAWVFTEGTVVRGRWSRRDASSVTVFSDSDGNPIQLVPGTTWIELAPGGSASLR